MRDDNICKKKREMLLAFLNESGCKGVPDRPGCVTSRGTRTSNQEEVPVLLAHRVPPVDTLNDALCKIVVVDLPDFAEEFLDSSERAQLCSVAQLASAL